MILFYLEQMTKKGSSESSEGGYMEGGVQPLRREGNVRHVYLKCSGGFWKEERLPGLREVKVYLLLKPP